MNRSIVLALIVSAAIDIAAIPAGLIFAEKLHGSAHVSITTEPVLRPDSTPLYNPPPPAIELTQADVEASTAAETVIVVQRPVPMKAPSPDKQFTCGQWQESQVGGTYRFCEWR